MKKRLKSWITSIFGLLIWALVIIAGVMNVFELRDEKFAPLSIILGAVLGYIFVMGKDEWIKELFDEAKSRFKK